MARITPAPLKLGRRSQVVGLDRVWSLPAAKLFFMPSRTEDGRLIGYVWSVATRPSLLGAWC
jgi:hypothetical protein